MIWDLLRLGTQPRTRAQSWVWKPAKSSRILICALLIQLPGKHQMILSFSLLNKCPCFQLLWWEAGLSNQNDECVVPGSVQKLVPAPLWALETVWAGQEVYPVEMAWRGFYSYAEMVQADGLEMPPLCCALPLSECHLGIVQYSTVQRTCGGCLVTGCWLWRRTERQYESSE